MAYRGTTERLWASFRNASEVLEDPSSLQLDILQNGAVVVGPIVQPALVRDALGLYRYDWAIPAGLPPGTYIVRWTAQLSSDPVGDPTVAFDSVDVLATAGPLTLAEAKQGLNITRTDSDDELAGWLVAATELVESVVGPLTARSVTEVHPASEGAAIYLRQTPVISVESIERRWDSSPLWLPADVEVEPLSGRLTVNAFYEGSGAWAGWGGVRVTYTAGRAQVPESIRKAIIIVLDHLWTTQRGWQSGAPGLRGQLPAAEGGAPIPAGYALPNRAEQLIEPWRRVAIG